MKEPQSFRFRAAAAVASRAWPMEEGLPPSFHPSHLLRYPLARPPACLQSSLTRPCPSSSGGHLAVSQGVRQLVQHVTTAKADGPPLLSYSPHPPLPSSGDGKGQRKAASAAACQSSSIGRGRRGSVGRRGRAKATAAAGDRDRVGEVCERGGVAGGSGESPLHIGRTVCARRRGSIESVEERTAAAAVDGRDRLSPSGRHT